MAKRIVVYSTMWCGDCRAAKSFLDSLGIEYQEVFLEETPDAVKLVMSVNNGKRSVPTIDIDGRYYNCSPFTSEKRKILAEALNISL